MIGENATVINIQFEHVFIKFILPPSEADPDRGEGCLSPGQIFTDMPQNRAWSPSCMILSRPVSHRSYTDDR